MRAFILCTLLAMATTVSCQDFAISAACKNSTDALDSNANVTQAFNNNHNTGCTVLSFDSCTYTEATGAWACDCVGTYPNKTSVDATVTGAGAQPCYIDIKYEFFGNQTYNNASRAVTLVGTQTAQTFMIFGSACNSTDFGGFFGSIVNETAPAIANADNLKKGNATWVGAKLTVSSSCGGSRSVSTTFSTGTTTVPPTATSSSSSSSTGTNGNTTTTAPPTVPPTSSTGKGSGASIIASSFALVASLVAAVTILA